MSEANQSNPPLVNQKPSDDDIPFGDNIKGNTLPDEDRPPARRLPQPSAPKSYEERIEEQIRRVPPPPAGNSQQGQLRREIFVAIMNGFAARGELSRRVPGTQLGVTTDVDVMNICRHAAGVASFAAEAAKDARI